MMDDAVPLIAVAILVLLVMAYFEWRLRNNPYGSGQIVPINADTLADLRKQLAQRVAECNALRAQKHLAHYERNLVIALLARVLIEEGCVGDGVSTLWAIGTGKDPHFEDWSNCLYLEPPEGSRYAGLGQLNWHFRDDHAHLIAELHAPTHGRKWDGRAKSEKNAATANWLKRLGDEDEKSLMGVPS